VKVLLRSKDVLHNFTVTQFRVKMDLVPGMITHLWLTPTVPGSYEILCEELCGVGHFAMRGRVVVTPQEEFDAWLAALPTFETTQALAAADPHAGAAQYAVRGSRARRPGTCGASSTPSATACAARTSATPTARR
jgi:cytochrome c oxidase subunit 2